MALAGEVRSVEKRDDDDEGNTEPPHLTGGSRTCTLPSSIPK